MSKTRTTKRRLLELVDLFAKARVAVVGDMTVDVYMYGTPHRLSREAPVVIVRYEGEDLMPGGAANVVNNLAALGVNVIPIGVLGDDEPGHKLVATFSGSRVARSGFLFERGRQTVTKTRILAGDTHTSKQQMLRVDRETCKPLDAATESRLLDLLERARTDVDAIIASDYGYDVFTPSVRSKLLDIARVKSVVADSRYRVTEFKGVTLIKPNEPEARLATGITGDSDEAIREMGRQLMETVRSRGVIITRGNKGMAVFDRSAEPQTIPICNTSHITGITDVTGAGDTVASLLGLGLACGASFVEAAHLATYAAAIVVTKRGAATVSVQELRYIIEEDLGKDS